MPIDDDEKAASTLGDRLLTGVRTLWKEVSTLKKTTNYAGTELEALKERVTVLERDMKRLKISKGMAKAKSAKLKAALVESDKKLSEIKTLLH
jgi:phage shock protein A